MGPEERFWRWRPRYHAIATRGWMNDPCGPFFNTHTGLYHLGFQWNPKGCEWGNMSWGSMVSSDLLHWDVSEVPSMVIGGEGQDPKGVYSGCALASNSIGANDGAITAFYTSCNHLPLHYTLPYVRGSERLHIAISHDNGRSWVKHSENPLLAGPPEQISVYGWRDPFVAHWPALDRLLGREPGESLYCIVSGSLRHKTPTVFLYRINTSSLTEWTFLSPLVDLGLNYSTSRWTGDFGINWEVANFISLCDGHGGVGNFLIVGAEGVRPTGHRKLLSKARAGSSQLWLSGPLTLMDGQPKLSFGFGGLLDHGCYYAGNSFWDPQSQEQVIFGWVMEADAPESHYHEQGWSGMLAAPRVLKVVSLNGVCRSLKTPVEQMDNFERQSEGLDTYRLLTLAALPDPRLIKLRGPQLSLHPQNLLHGSPKLRIPMETAMQWELEILFVLDPDTKHVGFDIIHSVLSGQKTSVTFTPGDETIVVDRSLSTGEPRINTAPEKAPHTLFYARDKNSQESLLEPLSIRVLFDTSVLEIFANDRTALTTRVYPERGSGIKDHAIIRPFAEQSGRSRSSTRLQSCNIWPLSLDNDQKRPDARL